MMSPSQAREFPNLARRFNAMLLVMIFPSVSCVFFMLSRTSNVRSSSPHISHVLTTVLKTERGGFSTLPSSQSFTQSNKTAVAFLLFSHFAQVVTTFLHTLVDGVRDRSGISSNNLTANFQLLSTYAALIARLCISVHALCAADEDAATRSSPLSGAHPSALLAAVRSLSPNAKLFICSAAMTPEANKSRPAWADPMESSSYPDALASAITCKTSSDLSPALAAASATSANTLRGGVKDFSTTIARRRSIASSTEPSRLKAVTTAP
mmetsp:Transcript_6969/g.9414  ORF Transcript_6969/g.9414 Transcript_6969/m.9414 type:complete len:266 (+) Transcript_6969:909-1706(+)